MKRQCTFLPMMFKSLCLIFILTISHYNCFPSPNDSLFISEVRSFILDKIGVHVRRSYYTKWSAHNKPHNALFVSRSSSVSAPEGFDIYGIHFGSNEERAREAQSKYASPGHHTFLYKTYATASTKLNSRFISYSSESKSFIMLHEFIHNYISDHRLKIPYEYEEALGDVVGNYGSIELMKISSHLNRKDLRKERSRNEKLYHTINNTIKKIDADSNVVDRLNLKCQKRIEKILEDAGLFLNDRFGYTVNNAFLLKNRNYSKNYFLLKQVLHKSGSVRNLLKIVEGGPNTAEGFEKYLKAFL